MGFTVAFSFFEGKHIVSPSHPIAVKVGDFLGIHYSRGSRIPSVPNSRGNDKVVEDSELFGTVNKEVYDESMRVGKVVSFADSVMIRSTYPLMAHFTGDLKSILKI